MRSAIRNHLGTADELLFFSKDRTPSPRKVFAHYMGSAPRSYNNVATPDGWDTAYLKVSGDSGRHAAYGGFWRDRPLERPPITGDWQLEDAKWEILTAQKLGIEGFFTDIAGIDLASSSWNRIKKLIDAANELGTGFKVAPMLDRHGPAVQTASPEDTAVALGYFVGKASSHHLEDGRFLLSVYSIEGFPPEFWTARADALAASSSVPVALLGVFVTPTKMSDYLPTLAYAGIWAPGSDPARLEVLPTPGVSLCREAGVKWLGAVQPQNVRPDQFWYDEACNTEALRASWRRVVREEADMVQLVTWNDFREGGQVVPSVGRGAAPAAISAFHAETWKYGGQPLILKDTLVLSHRDQIMDAVYTSNQTKLMVARHIAVRSPSQNLVEALTYLTEPAVVTVRIGGLPYTYLAPAGEFSMKFPSAKGTVSGYLYRAGAQIASVVSPFLVTGVPVSQDRSYFTVSTHVGTAGQHPMMTL